MAFGERVALAGGGGCGSRKGLKSALVAFRYPFGSSRGDGAGFDVGQTSVYGVVCVGDGTSEKETLAMVWWILAK